MAIWILFAALIDPVANLAIGVAIIAVLGALKITWSHLKEFSKDIHVSGNEALDELLRSSCIDFVNTKRAANPKKAAWLQALEGLEGEDGLPEVPHDVVMDVFDKGGDAKLSFEEFSVLIDHLNLSVDYNMKQKMFSFADRDNSNQMDNSEFEAAWTYLKEDLVEALLAKNFLDDAAILKVLAGIVVFFALFFPFFFLAIALWQNTSSFVSVVHSMFISGLGASQVAKNRRATAADGKAKGMAESLKHMLASLTLKPGKKAA